MPSNGPSHDFSRCFLGLLRRSIAFAVALAFADVDAAASDVFWPTCIGPSFCFGLFLAACNRYKRRKSMQHFMG